MANTRDTVSNPQPPTREFTEFEYTAFALIVVRKHKISVPAVDVQSLSDEELARRVDLLRELAHLPPT